MPEKVLLLLGLLLVLCDIGCLRLLRRLLLDFLIGAHNRKHATQIHDAQSFDDRLRLDYIGGHLKRYQREFRFWLRLYHGFLICLLPKYAALITLAVVFNGGKVFRVVLYVFCAVSLLFIFVLRFQFDGSWISRYAKKRK
ncbi:MAG: hypothetical protein IKS05_09610 [Oscillospiraceae bacterium]|nr:hypothetical protein [Oscillospiraceae bacterium]